ncbi:MAG TPA: GNAT family protein [Solirubrobacteraceae bacterium]|nr:GNAT family protein [Solirubrobacteraceae bacterium]
MSAPDQVTERLELWRPDPERDLADAFVLMSDPRSWEHAPALRHAAPEVKRGWLQRAAGRWQEDSLSYWIARSRADGAFVGMGGVQRHVTGSWNLLYRVSVPWRRRGLAVEIGRAAMLRAQLQDAGVPVIAWIQPHNLRLRRTAERLGLSDRGLFVDPADGLARHAYTPGSPESLALEPGRGPAFGPLAGGRTSGAPRR